MAHETVRESHSGPKRGRGAWMPKKDAKKAANVTRRRNDKLTTKQRSR